MEKQEFIEKITAIGTCEDDVTRRTMLVELQETVSADYDLKADLTAKNTELNSEIEKLREHNMNLFLQVSSSEDAPPDIPPDRREPRKFEDLFNEKGALK